MKPFARVHILIVMATAARHSREASDAREAGAAESESVLERYRRVQERIAAAAQRSGQAPERIILVAVTKFASIDQIRQLIELGHQDFGENRVQQLQKRAALVNEFISRHRELRGEKNVNIPETIRWHMIGHLQRNKVRKVINLVRLIQSVDSLRLVEEIHQCTARREEPIEVLVQVSMADEKQKSGIAPAAARHLIEQIETMLGLRTRGLMFMGPLVDDPETLRPLYQRARELFEDIRTSGIAGESFDILSMGMSNDYQVAIECGANLVRIGTAIFGQPQTIEDDGEAEDD